MAIPLRVVGNAVSRLAAGVEIVWIQASRGTHDAKAQNTGAEPTPLDRKMRGDTLIGSPFLKSVQKSSVLSMC